MCAKIWPIVNDFSKRLHRFERFKSLLIVSQSDKNQFFRISKKVQKISFKYWSKTPGTILKIRKLHYQFNSNKFCL